MDQNDIALIYTRVSTTKQYNEGDSPRDQEMACRAKAKFMGFSEENIFTFEEAGVSGRKSTRPVLERLFQFIERHEGKVKAVFIKDIDRLTREGSSVYNRFKSKLAGYGIQLIDERGFIQKERNSLEGVGFTYDWSIYSPTATSENIKAETAKDEVMQILTRMIGREIILEQEGYQVRESNLGYKNEKITLPSGKKYVIQTHHPVESKWIITMFELRAEGVLTDKEICERLNSMGFKTRRQLKHHPETKEVIGSQGERPLEPKMLEKYIKTPVYCGIQISKWTHNQPVRCAYPGLVSIETFNKANRGKIHIEESPNEGITIKRNLKQKIRSKHNPLYPLRFVIRCPACGKAFKGSASTGKSGQKFPAYHCDRGHKNYRITVNEFNKQVGYFIEELKFKPEFINLFEAIARDTWKTKQKDLLGQSIDVEKHVITLKEQKKTAIGKILKVESPIVIKALEEQIEELDQEIKQASNTRNQLDLKEEELQAYLKFARFFMEHPGEMLLSTDDNQELIRIWSSIFAELPTYEEILNRTPKLSLVLELGQRSEINIDELVIPRRIELRFTG